MSFWLVIVVSRNSIQFCQYTFLKERVAGVDNINWITAHDYGKPKCHSFMPSKLKMGNFGPQYCLTNGAIKHKLSWYHFSLEKIPHPLEAVITSSYYGKYAIPFLLDHPV